MSRYLNSARDNYYSHRSCDSNHVGSDRRQDSYPDRRRELRQKYPSASDERHAYHGADNTWKGSDRNKMQTDRFGRVLDVQESPCRTNTDTNTHRRGCNESRYGSADHHGSSQKEEDERKKLMDDRIERDYQKYLDNWYKKQSEHRKSHPSPNSQDGHSDKIERRKQKELKEYESKDRKKDYASKEERRKPKDQQADSGESDDSCVEVKPMIKKELRRSCSKDSHSDHSAKVKRRKRRETEDTYITSGDGSCLDHNNQLAKTERKNRKGNIEKVLLRAAAESINSFGTDSRVNSLESVIAGNRSNISTYTVTTVPRSSFTSSSTSVSTAISLLPDISVPASIPTAIVNVPPNVPNQTLIRHPLLQNVVFPQSLPSVNIPPQLIGTGNDQLMQAQMNQCGLLSETLHGAGFPLPNVQPVLNHNLHPPAQLVIPPLLNNIMGPAAASSIPLPTTTIASYMPAQHAMTTVNNTGPMPLHPVMQPIVQPAPQLNAQSMGQPLVQPVVQPVMQPVGQHAMQPGMQPVGQHVPQPMAQSVVTPTPFQQPQEGLAPPQYPPLTNAAVPIEPVIANAMQDIADQQQEQQMKKEYELKKAVEKIKCRIAKKEKVMNSPWMKRRQAVHPWFDYECCLVYRNKQNTRRTMGRECKRGDVSETTWKNVVDAERTLRKVLKDKRNAYIEECEASGNVEKVCSVVLSSIMDRVEKHIKNVDLKYHRKGNAFDKLDKVLTKRREKGEYPGNSVDMDSSSDDDHGM